MTKAELELPPEAEDPNQLVAFNLDRLLRVHRVTIRQVAAAMQITLKRVREVRASKRVRSITAWAFTHAITALVAERITAQLAGTTTTSPEVTGPVRVGRDGKAYLTIAQCQELIAKRFTTPATRPNLTNP